MQKMIRILKVPKEREKIKFYRVIINKIILKVVFSKIKQRIVVKKEI